MQTLALLGGIVALSGHVFWIRGILKGTMHLNLATWILWMIFDACVLTASITAGAPAPFLSVGFVIGAMLVVITILFKGTWKWGVIETICSAVAVVSLLGWYVFGPLVALVLLTVGKYSAEIPTIVRGYQRPERKQSWIWFVSAFAASTNIFAAGSWTIAQSFFPTSAFVFSILTGLVHLRHHKNTVN